MNWCAGWPNGVLELGARRCSAFRTLSKGYSWGWAERRFHVYPYREESVAPSPGYEATIPRPTVDVVIGHGLHEFRLRALIDTGAPVTVFDSAVAEALGIKLGEPGALVEKIFLLGSPRKAERRMVHLSLPPFDDISWETEVSFLRDELPVAFAGLLGTLGFLDKWVVSFNFYDSYFVVEEHDSFVSRMPVDVYDEYQRRFFDSEWSPPGT